jgi:anti-sigma B factor antagonist
MAIKRREVRTVTILSVQGRFFGDKETDELQAALMKEAESGNTRLVLNFQECEALNSVALGVLMRAHANYKGRGAEIKICSLGKRLKDLFTMTKLIMVFDHHESEEEALAAFIPNS